MEESIDFSSFAIRKIGVIQSETVLRLDEFVLHTALYQIAGDRALLLGALNKSELAFFQKYQGGFGGVGLAIQGPGDRRPLRIFARCTISRISEMPQRDDLSLFETELKNRPADLESCLKDYASILACLKEDYEKFKGQSIKMVSASPKLAGLANRAELFAGDRALEAAVFLVAVDRIELVVRVEAEAVPRGSDCAIKLYSPTNQFFFLKGKAAEVTETSSGVCQVVADIEFCPDLVEILADHRARARAQVPTAS